MLHSVHGHRTACQQQGSAGVTSSVQSISNSAGSFLRRRSAKQRHSAMSSQYDHPALYSNDDAFWDRSYWDKRYQQDPTTFEWYRSYESLQPILTQHFPRDQQILQIGVGTSRLQVDMADDGYKRITNTDYSPVAIQRLQHLYPSYNDRLGYAVADARSMPQYASGSYHGVLDKGTLDALLCGDTDERDAADLLQEVWRLLAPGTAYVMITSASPRSRLKYLHTPATPWSSILVYEVGQQGAMGGPYECCTQLTAGSSTSSRTTGNSCDESSTIRGLEQALKLPVMGYSHLVYVCYKPAQSL